MSVDITFTGTIERVKDWGDNTDLSLKVEDGGNFPSRAIIKLQGSNFFEQGQTVTVTTSRLPYGKTRSYVDRDGNDKTITDLIYPGASVAPVGEATVGSDDIPF